MDPALLRPGRLEVQVEVPRPDTDGRRTIVAIHSRRLRERGSLDQKAAAALRSGALAKVTWGFSGADLAGLLRSATSFALERYVDAALLDGWAAGEATLAASRGRFLRASSRAAEKRQLGVGLLEVQFEDLVRALHEVAPTGSAASRAELHRGEASSRRASRPPLRPSAIAREWKLRWLTAKAMRDDARALRLEEEAQGVSSTGPDQS